MRNYSIVHMPHTSKPDHLSIGFVFDDTLDKPDGVQQYILALGDWFRSAGHEVHYLVGNTKRTDIPNVHSLSRNVAVQFNGNGMSIPLPTNRKLLRRLLVELDLDVLHIQIPYSPWLAQRIILQASPQTVIFGTFHVVGQSSLVHKATKALALWTKVSLKRFDEIVSVSSAAADYALATYGITTTVLPNTIDFYRFHDAPPSPLLTPQKTSLTAPLMILFLGRLVPRKGCLVLLQAIEYIRTNNLTEVPFQTLICGDGPLRSDLETFVQLNQLESIVSFAGFISEADKPGYYAAADISVFPATGGESFGIVLLEAMASGRSAVLAADNDGYKEILAKRSTQLFMKNDAEALALRLVTYIDSQELRTSAAAWGEEFSKGFDNATVGRQLIEHYRTHIA